jgi:hypothetical protein
MVAKSINPQKLKIYLAGWASNNAQEYSAVKTRVIASSSQTKYAIHQTSGDIASRTGLNKDHQHAEQRK